MKKIEQTKGNIFEVKRFAVHDGPGVRTTLFLKGCPLRCRWCHNPESISPQPQLAYFAHKCINCGECVEACPENAHKMVNGIHHFDRERCLNCGACETVCLGNALRFYGRRISVEDALHIAIEDRDFFGTEGGVTLSGGEPLLQAEFCSELLKRLKAEGVHTAVDTCACVRWEAIEKVLPFTDIFLVDFKHADNAEHQKVTGQGNKLIINNLQRLSNCGAKIEVRLPLIPGCNNSEKNLRESGIFLGSLKLERIKVLPFHSMARSKYPALGMRDTMPDVPEQDEKALQQAIKILNG